MGAYRCMIPLIYPDIKEDFYFIEEDGQIYSNYKKDYICPRKDKDGYLQFGFASTIPNKKKYVRIATLVIYTFIGPPPQEMQDPTVNHKDNNILNNHYSNLEWMERSINSSIRQNKGAGELNGQAILNWEDVKSIREKYRQGLGSYSKIAEEYNVSKSCIASIIKLRSWRE